MKLPITVDDLPPALAAHVRTAQAAGLWGDAIEAFEDWLDEADDRPPAVVVMLGFMIYRDAVEVMVDEVAERCARALDLVDGAKAIRGQAALRREIVRTIGRAKQEARAATKRAEQSREQPLESLSPSDLRELAYKLGESKQPEDHATAARAWVLAAEHEEDAFDRRDCLGRAALAFADAKDWAEAMPRLAAIVKKPADYEDWIADYAWYRMLDKARDEGDVATFQKHWKRALAMKRDDHFPFAHPVQDAYLAFAVDHELADIARHVAAVVIEHRKPRERKALKPLLDRAAKL